MLIRDEIRASDSPFVEQVWRCHSEGVTPFLSIATGHCELVVSKFGGEVTITIRGPETRAITVADYPCSGEWFGILFKTGTFLPHVPTGRLVDAEMSLSVDARNTDRKSVV